MSPVRRSTNDGHCEVCQLHYAPWHPPDVRLHHKRHDAVVNGLPWPAMQREVVVRDTGALRVIMVSPDGVLAQRKRAERIAQNANLETRYDVAPYHAHDAEESQLETHVFVAVRAARAVGLLVIDRRDHVVRIPWVEWDANSPAGWKWTSTEARQWTVAFVWVLATMRRTGIASLLLECAAQHAGAAVTYLAWYTPFSPAGEALARARCPEAFICGR